MAKMKSVIMVAPKKVEIREMNIPTPGPNQVLVKIKSCNLCTAEQRFFVGEYGDKIYPINFGHEYAGVIEAIGSEVLADKYPIGARVAVRNQDSCGACYYCRIGRSDLCTHQQKANKSMIPYEGVRMMGGLSQYCVVDISGIFFLNDNITFHQAIFAEPLACVCNSVGHTDIRLGSDVVVIGGGIMGMLHTMVAKLRGARVIMSEPDDARRELALKLGADIVINPKEVDAVEEVKRITDGRGGDVIFNTTPISAVAKQACDMVAKAGKVVMYSSQHPDKPIEISPNWIHSAQPIITGSVNPSIYSFQESVDLINKGIVDPTPLFYGSFPMEKAEEAFLTAMRPDTYRVAIDMEDDVI